MTTILVTGVGAIIGYGILQSLRSSSKEVFLIGSDCYSDAVGQVWADDFIVAPLTSSENYISWLQDVIRKYNVDMLIPGIEQDVTCFSRNRNLFKALTVTVVLNDKRLIDLTRDKWLMHQELSSNNIKVVIDSYLEGDYENLVEKIGLPFILKPRCSYASKGLLRVRNKEGFLAHAEKLGVELMAQPIVGTDDKEFTVGIFGDGTGKVCASISLQRRLSSDGSTSKACVVHENTLDKVVSSLCEHFKPVGPTNLQFRKDGEHWKLLEINPRISSSSSIRTAFGYNEAEMCIDYYIKGKKIVQPDIQSGFAVRYIKDYIFDDRNNF